MLINLIIIFLILISFLILTYRKLYNKIPDMKVLGYGLSITEYTEVYETWFPLLALLWSGIIIVTSSFILFICL